MSNQTFRYTVVLENIPIVFTQLLAVSKMCVGVEIGGMIVNLKYVYSDKGVKEVYIKKFRN
jgi:hypothetical protein